MFTRKLRRRPSAATVLATLALFASLGGVGYSATGGTFILGRANTATTKSTLSANIADKALQIQNGSGTLGATALGLSVAVGKPPFTVNSPTKVANLNADKLDGMDASAFMTSSIYQRRIDSTGTDALNGSVYAMATCDPGDVVLNGGYNNVDAGTQIVSSLASYSLRGDGVRVWSQFVYWINDTTPDEVWVFAHCLNQA